ncbi:MAG: helix-turn-helix domain-containing protein [Actinomycetota bacterium]
MRRSRKGQAPSGQLQFSVTGGSYGGRSDEPLLLTVKEAAALMRVGRDTTYSLVAQRRIPCVKLGKQIRIPRRALIAHLEKEAVQQGLDLEGART